MKTDICERLSREIEYHRRRGLSPIRVEMSPEVHEALRILARKPQGYILREHDGVEVWVIPQMIGPNAWRVVCREGVPRREN